MSVSIQKYFCSKCGNKYLDKKIEDGHKIWKEEITRGLCEKCKLQSQEDRRNRIIERNKSKKLRTLNSQRMKRNNPMFDENTRQRVSETFKEKYANGELNSSFNDPKVKNMAEKSVREFWQSDRSDHIAERFSKRMKRDNPMFDQEVVNKVHENLRTQRENGELVFPKGKDHWLWKGNRPFNLFVRSRLYIPWIFPILSRDNFTCIECGRNKCKLHVHHLVALESIISEVLEDYGVENITEFKETDLYSEIADAIVAKHTLDMGITVCRRCHAKIDARYKGKEHDIENSKN